MEHSLKCTHTLEHTLKAPTCPFEGGYTPKETKYTGQVFEEPKVSLTYDPPFRRAGGRSGRQISLRRGSEAVALPPPPRVAARAPQARGVATATAAAPPRRRPRRHTHRQHASV